MGCVSRLNDSTMFTLSCSVPVTATKVGQGGSVGVRTLSLGQKCQQHRAFDQGFNLVPLTHGSSDCTSERSYGIRSNVTSLKARVIIQKPRHQEDGLDSWRRIFNFIKNLGASKPVSTSRCVQITSLKLQSNLFGLHYPLNIVQQGHSILQLLHSLIHEL